MNERETYQRERERERKREKEIPRGELKGTRFQNQSSVYNNFWESRDGKRV
jgi:hypothetical protein